MGPVLWEIGDQWQDLREQIRAAGTAWVVTSSGALRAVDTVNDQVVRGGTVSATWPTDGWWHPAGPLLVATPCGLVWAHGEATTPVLLVIAGVDPDCTAQELRQRVVRRLELLGPVPEVPAVAGHWASPCGARYCPVSAS